MAFSRNRGVHVASNPKVTQLPNESNLECLNCDNEISLSRRQALPDTKICIECAKAKEELTQKKSQYGRR